MSRRATGHLAQVGSMTADEAGVLATIDPERTAELTSALVRAGGEVTVGPEHATAMELARVLGSIGADVVLDEAAPGRPNLIARLGSRQDGEGIVFLGHSDVVAVGEGWSGDPFTPRRRGDELIGRGTCDMKGGLAAVIAAMAAVHHHDPSLPMTLICTVDEEDEAIGISRYLDENPPAPYTACVVAEPTGMTVVTGCRGASNLRVEISGASAHAGTPDEGASAILAAADVIAEVERDAREIAATPHPVLGPATWNVGTIAGGHGTSIVPDRCTLTLDRRTLPHEDAQSILDDLLDRARRRHREAQRPGTDRILIEGAVDMVMPGFETALDSPLVLCAQEAVRAAGCQGETGAWTAACEGGFLARHHDVPTVVLGPGDLTSQAHQPDERVSVGELHRAAHAYALIAMRSAASTISSSPSSTASAAGPRGM